MRISLISIFYIALLSAFISACSSVKPSTGGWKTLFNGSSVDKFRGYQLNDFPAARRVDNGMLKTVIGTNNIDPVTRKPIKTSNWNLNGTL